MRKEGRAYELHQEREGKAGLLLLRARHNGTSQEAVSVCLNAVYVGGASQIER